MDKYSYNINHEMVKSTVGNWCKSEDVEQLQAENEQLKKWQIKPSEAICLTDLACRHKKVFKND